MNYLYYVVCDPNTSQKESALGIMCLGKPAHLLVVIDSSVSVLQEFVHVAQAGVHPCFSSPACGKGMAVSDTHETKSTVL